MSRNTSVVQCIETSNKSCEYWKTQMIKEFYQKHKVTNENDLRRVYYIDRCLIKVNLPWTASFEHAWSCEVWFLIHISWHKIYKWFYWYWNDQFVIFIGKTISVNWTLLTTPHTFILLLIFWHKYSNVVKSHNLGRKFPWNNVTITFFVQ